MESLGGDEQLETNHDGDFESLIQDLKRKVCGRRSDEYFKKHSSFSGCQVIEDYFHLKKLILII
jgi:hypothetical protein